MTDWRALIGQRVTVRNDRGALYRGTLEAVGQNGDVFMVVDRTSLNGCSGGWVQHKKELQKVTQPELVEGDDK